MIHYNSLSEPGSEFLDVVLVADVVVVVVALADTELATAAETAIVSAALGIASWGESAMQKSDDC